MTIGIRLKLVTGVLAALLIAAAGACALVYHQVEDELGAAAVSEAGFVLRQLQATLEAYLGLGLELEELPGMAALLGRALNDRDASDREATDARPSAIRAVAVFDDTGRIVFSSRPAEVGERLPAAALPAVADPSVPVRHELGPALTLSLPLATGFGTRAGGVAVEVDREALARQATAFGLRLLELALAVYGAVGAVAAVLADRIARGLEGRLAATAAGLQRLAETLTTAPEAAGRGAVGDFAEAVRARHDLLSRADAEVSRLDELA